MQSGDYLWNADNATVLDMATNLSAIDCLSSDDGSSSAIDWSICLPTTMGAGKISIDACTDAEADWASHTDNDCATTEGGSINFCSLKPPVAVTPMEETPSTLTALPTQTDTVFKDTECDKNADHPYNNKVTTLQSQKNYQKIIFHGGWCVMLHGGRQEHPHFHVPCCGP